MKFHRLSVHYTYPTINTERLESSELDENADTTKLRSGLHYKSIKLIQDSYIFLICHHRFLLNCPLLNHYI